MNGYAMFCHETGMFAEEKQIDLTDGAWLNVSLLLTQAHLYKYILIKLHFIFYEEYQKEHSCTTSKKGKK